MNWSQIFTAVSVIGTIAWINSHTSTPTPTIRPISHSTTTTTTSTQQIWSKFTPVSNYEEEEERKKDYYHTNYSYEEEEEDDDDDDDEEEGGVGDDGNCHPSYSPCVPYAYDVDCASGKGNWPVYVYWPVRVIWPDVYDLDRDGDGIWCEK